MGHRPWPPADKGLAMGLVASLNWLGIDRTHASICVPRLPCRIGIFSMRIEWFISLVAVWSKNNILITRGSKKLNLNHRVSCVGPRPRHTIHTLGMRGADGTFPRSCLVSSMVYTMYTWETRCCDKYRHTSPRGYEISSSDTGESVGIATTQTLPATKA